MSFMLDGALDFPIKRCSRCGLDKPIREFHRRGVGQQSWCKECQREWDAAYHQRVRPIRKLQKRQRREVLVAWMRQIKTSQPCVDCGGFFHPAAMTYDHLPGTEKRDEISNLLYGGYRQVLLDEMAKCDLVCANCHAVRTYMRAQAAAM